MSRCKCCGKWIAPEWMNWVIVVVVISLLSAIFTAVFTACATRTVSISSDGTMNSTSTVLLYCPAAEVMRLTDGNRTAETLSESAGVGATVQEVLKP